ncbi:hypothetical protein D3C87_1088450 [compost metagenome]
MKKVFLILGVFIYTSISNAQVAGALYIYDSRSMNEAPNFLSHSIRADFKERSAVGVPGSGFYSTNLTLAQWGDDDNSGDKKHQLNFNNGGIFYRNAYPLDSKWGKWRQILMTNDNGNVGIGTETPLEALDISGNIVLRNYQNVGAKGNTIFFSSYGADLHGPQIRSYLAYADGENSRMGLVLSSYSKGYGDELFIMDGNVGIGEINPKNKLDVNGTIHSQEVKVDMNNWSDFVFKKEYAVPTLEEVEKHITEKGHLENIPNEEEVLKNGINLGEMNAKLLQKIEEMTLYIIEQNKQIIDLNKRLEKVESK